MKMMTITIGTTIGTPSSGFGPCERSVLRIATMTAPIAAIPAIFRIGTHTDWFGTPALVRRARS